MAGIAVVIANVRGIIAVAASVAVIPRVIATVAAAVVAVVTSVGVADILVVRDDVGPGVLVENVDDLITVGQKVVLDLVLHVVVHLFYLLLKYACEVYFPIVGNV